MAFPMWYAAGRCKRCETYMRSPFRPMRNMLPKWLPCGECGKPVTLDVTGQRASYSGEFGRTVTKPVKPKSSN
jgi:hypothetical protein